MCACVGGSYNPLTVWHSTSLMPRLYVCGLGMRLVCTWYWVHCQLNSIQILSHLLGKVAVLIIQDSAAAKGHLDIVKFLTLRCCNPTSRTSDGTTPIHWAARYGHLEILKFLITDLKCSANIPDQPGCTPLHFAAEKGHLHVVKFFIDEQGCV